MPNRITKIVTKIKIIFFYNTVLSLVFISMFFF